MENKDRKSHCLASWLTQAHPRPHNTAGTVASHQPAGENYLLCAFFPISRPHISPVSAISLWNPSSFWKIASSKLSHDEITQGNRPHWIPTILRYLLTPRTAASRRSSAGSHWLIQQRGAGWRGRLEPKPTSDWWVLTNEGVNKWQVKNAQNFSASISTVDYIFVFCICPAAWEDYTKYKTLK